MDKFVKNIKYLNSGRVKVYIEGSNIPIISSSPIITKYNIHKDNKVQDSDFELFLKDSNLFYAMDYCMRILSRFSYSISQIKKKLKRKGFEGSVIKEVIGRLEELQILNDEEKILSEIKRMNNKNFSYLRIKNELYKKDYDKELISKYLIYDNAIEKRKAEKLFKKKLSILKDKNKAVCYLLRTGFGSNIIYDFTKSDENLEEFKFDECN
ncbi:MAG: RecX family transcriptional regulator [Candidatus Hydrogenedentota bacterium]